MARQEHARPAAVAGGTAAGTCGPHWRSILEDRWQARLAEVTELSLAYHAVTAAADTHADTHADGTVPAAEPAASSAAGVEARRLLRRTVTARRKLADVEEALSRLTAGRFGYCEQCGTAIPGALLIIVPEARYCSRCADEAAPARRAQPQAIAGQGRR